MRQLDIGCWEDFKKKYSPEIIGWAEEQAGKKGISLEDDTEVFYDFHNHENAVIYFDRDAVKEAIGCAVELSKYWLKRSYNRRKKLYSSRQMQLYWAKQSYIF